jgi:hypothetical protein
MKWGVHIGMSALPPKADMTRTSIAALPPNWGLVGLQLTQRLVVGTGISQILTVGYHSDLNFTPTYRRSAHTTSQSRWALPSLKSSRVMLRGMSTNG